METALTLRKRLQQSSCSFNAKITADYGDMIHVFDLHCQMEQDGSLAFTVLEPESIAGITGVIEAGDGKLLFDDTVLAFELLADGLVTPVSAPWIVTKTLRGGYIHASAKTADGTKLVIHDTYEEYSLQLDIWLDAESTPTAAEILWEGRRILSLIISDFCFL